jgi:hypothetical protein
MPNYRKPENNVSMEQFQALVLRVEALEASKEQAKEPDKTELIEKAVELGIGPKSTLSRWSAEKLAAEIDKAE